MRVFPFVLGCLFYFNSYAQSVAIKEEVIGTQTWTAENLNVDHFRNGDPIKQATSYEDWKRADVNKRPAWCYCNFDSTNGPVYGKLYNEYAVMDPRGLAPQGWRIPKEEDWKQLIQFLGGPKKAAKKMKSTYGWYNDANGNNSSGFNGLPGSRQSLVEGIYGEIGHSGDWWIVESGHNRLTLHYFTTYAHIGTDVQGPGFSVRCIKINQ